MRVLINALGATMGGALRHLTNFLPALADAPGSHSYEVLMRSSVLAACGSGRVRVTRWEDDRAASSIRRAFADLVTSGFQARNYDVLVSLMNFGPILCPIPHILFQRNALYYSPAYRASLDPVARVELALRRRWTIESMRFAHLVVTPSHSMTELIRQDCPTLPKARFHTLYHGFDRTALNSPEASRTESGIDGNPKLLYTAHLGRYKNFEVLLRAVQLLKSAYPRIRLILTFGPSDHGADFEHYDRLARELGVHENVIFTGRVRQEQIGSLYRAADIFLFPSLCESFGFPLLEAMGFGIPVIASSIPTNRELCGDAALYFDVNDAGRCADQIRSVLENSSRATLLSQRGSEVLRSFDWSWSRYAREFAGIVESAALRRAA